MDDDEPRCKYTCLWSRPRECWILKTIVPLTVLYDDMDIARRMRWLDHVVGRWYSSEKFLRFETHEWTTGFFRKEMNKKCVTRNYLIKLKCIVEICDIEHQNEDISDVLTAAHNIQHSRSLVGLLSLLVV